MASSFKDAVNPTPKVHNETRRLTYHLGLLLHSDTDTNIAVLLSAAEGDAKAIPVSFCSLCIVHLALRSGTLAEGAWKARR